MIIDYLKGDEAARKILSRQTKSNLYVTEISFYELADGIFRKKSKKDFDKFVSFMSRFKIIPTTNMFALEAARIGAELRKRGLIIDDMDLMVAGMMRRCGFEKIITRNKKHFGAIKGIKVVDY